MRFALALLIVACDGSNDELIGVIERPTPSPITDASTKLDAVAIAPQPDASDSAPPPGDASTWFSLKDSLKNGTKGNAIGGAFGQNGWTVTSRTDRIWWSIPTLGSGAIELTMANVTLSNMVVSDNEVFSMYEAGFGMGEPLNYAPEYRENHYKTMLRIYGSPESQRPGWQKLMWGMCPSGSPGYGACGCASFFEEPFQDSGPWDGSPQKIRIEWGGGKTRYSRNGSPVIDIDWSASGLAFGPSALHVSLGSPRASAWSDAGMPIGALFSDVTIEGNTAPTATCK